MYKNILDDYLRFNRKERIGFIAVIALISGIYLIPKLMANKSHMAIITADSTLIKAIDTLQTKKDKSRNGDNDLNGYEDNYVSHFDPTYKPKPYVEGELFKFDPNTLDAKGWQKLGLGDRIIKILLNYRNKGGKFYKNEDLLKIWGMPEGFYERVAPYIDLPDLSQHYKTETLTSGIN